jgi:hypothetical protein
MRIVRCRAWLALTRAETDAQLRRVPGDRLIPAPASQGAEPSLFSSQAGGRAQGGLGPPGRLYGKEVDT